MSTRIITRTMYGTAALALALGLLAAAIPQPARAMEVRPNTGSIAAGEVINDDLLLANDTVDMAGTVNGNVIAAGGQITVSGTVNGDVIAAGGIINITGTVNGNVLCGGNTLQLDGPVSGSLFCGGYNIILGPNAKVGNNAYVGAFSLTAQSGSVIGRDVAVGAYQFILGGEVKRDVNAGVSALKITGTVGRNVTADVDKPDANSQQANYMPFTQMSSGGYSTTVLPIPSGLQITDSAKIGGKLSYRSPADQSAAVKSQPAGGIQYTYRVSTNSSNASTNINPAMLVLQHFLDVLREFLTLLIVGALAVWLLSPLLTRSRNMLQAKPVPSFGWGFLLIIALPIGMFFAGCLVFLLGLALGVVTLGGLMGAIWSIGFSTIGLSFGIYCALVCFGAKLVVALLAGDWIIRQTKKEYAGSIFWPLLIGLAVYTVLFAIPFLIGWILSAVIMVFGFGAIWLTFRDWYQNRKAQPAA